MKLSTFINIFKAKPILNNLIECCGNHNVYNMSKINKKTKNLFESFIVEYKIDKEAIIKIYLKKFCKYCDSKECKFKCSQHYKTHNYGMNVWQCPGHYKCTFVENFCEDDMLPYEDVGCPRCGNRDNHNGHQLYGDTSDIDYYEDYYLFCKDCVKKLFTCVSKDRLKRKHLTEYGKNYFRSFDSWWWDK